MKKWWHLIYWLLITVIFLTERTFLIQKVGLGYFFQCTAVRLTLIISLAYFHLYVLIPRFLERSRYLFYALLVLVSLMIYVSLQDLYDIYLYGFVIGYRHYKNDGFWYPFPMNLLTTAWYLLLTTAFKLSLDWYEQRKAMRQPVPGHDEMIQLRSGTQTVPTRLADIIYVQGLKDYSIVYTLSDKVIVKGSLKTIEKILSPPRFLRIHKSYIIAPVHVKSTGVAKVILLNGTEIPIGRTFRDVKILPHN